MNKIIGYFTGIMCWFNAAVCFAEDKFEILPDLPESMSYAMQPAAASTVSGGDAVSILGSAQSVGNEPNIISVIISLLFVILLIYFTGILYAKLNKIGVRALKKQRGEYSNSCVSVISTTRLGNNKSLHVVELDGKRMLIGASAGAIQLIKDLGPVRENSQEEEYSRIEIPNIKIPKIEIPRIEIPSVGFSKIMTKTHRKSDIDECGLPEKSNCQKQEEPAQDGQNSDMVIDSLFTSQTQNNTVPEADGIINSLFSSQIQNNTASEVNTEKEEVLEHTVDPDEFVLYKKYL